MRYRFRFSTKDKQKIAICRDVVSAAAGWQQIFGEYQIFIPEPKYEGTTLKEDPEDPKAVPCAGCVDCGIKGTGSF